MKKFISIITALLLAVIGGFVISDAFAINPLYVIIPGFAASFIVRPGMATMLVATSPAAIGAWQFNLNYLPEFLIWDHLANPLTNLRVEENSMGVLVDLPAAGIAEVRNYRRFGLIASTVRMLRLANGELKGKNVTITATIAAAVAVAFQASSDCAGTNTFKYNVAALPAGAPTSFQDFLALFLPGLAAGDTVLVEFANGHNQLFNQVELLELTALWQNNQIATGFQVNNVLSDIKKATVTQAIVGVAYVMSVYKPV